MQSPPSLVGVRTGWLHRAGQEARGCSQRCLVLLITVFSFFLFSSFFLSSFPSFFLLFYFEGTDKGIVTGAGETGDLAAGESLPASLCLHSDWSVEEGRFACELFVKFR